MSVPSHFVIFAISIRGIMTAMLNLSNFVFQLFKVSYSMFLIALFFLDAYFLGLDRDQLAVALLGSLCGSLTLNYFRRSRNLMDRSLKIFGSATGGVFIGAAVTFYFRIEAPQIAGLVYYLASFVCLVLMSALLSVANDNAKVIITNIVRGWGKVDGETVEKKVRIETREIGAGERPKGAKHQHREAVTAAITEAPTKTKDEDIIYE